MPYAYYRHSVCLPNPWMAHRVISRWTHTKKDSRKGMKSERHYNFAGRSIALLKKDYHLSPARPYGKHSMRMKTSGWREVRIDVMAAWRGLTVEQWKAQTGEIYWWCLEKGEIIIIIIIIIIFISFPFIIYRCSTIDLEVVIKYSITLVILLARSY